MFEELFALGDGLDWLRITLAVLSVATSIGYQIIEHQPPSALRTGLKTAAIGLFVPLPPRAWAGRAASPACGSLPSFERRRPLPRPQGQSAQLHARPRRLSGEPPLLYRRDGAACERG
jgi:hypothetical protein